MPEATVILAFIAASLVVLLIPGPGVIYVVARSASQGYKAGLASVMGLSSGALVHVAAATVGLSALLVTSATAFSLVKILGAGYLIYLGIRIIFAKGSVLETKTSKPVATHRLIVDGMVISILNPKIAVFFLAFLPQFVNPERGSVPLQLLGLGLLYVALSVITDGGYALLAGKIRQWFNGRFIRGPIPRYISGSIFIGLGIHTALTGRKLST